MPRYTPKPDSNAYTGNLPNPNPGYLPDYYDNRGDRTQRPNYSSPTSNRNTNPGTTAPTTLAVPAQSQAVKYAIYAAIGLVAVYLIYTMFK
jgi:hypothetical protein